MSEKSIRVFFGHHKCASTYVNQVIAHLCALLGLKIKIEYLAQVLPMDYHLREPHKTRLKAILDSLANEEYDFLCHGNADRALVECLERRGYRGFHMIRDPRDIVVSGYFSHRYSHPTDPDFNPWLLDHRKRLEQLDQENGLVCEIEFCQTYFDRLAQWNYNNPKVYETRFERLTLSPEEEFAKIFSFIGIKVPRFDLFRLGSLVINKLEQRAFGIPMTRREYCPLPFLRRILRLYSFKKSAQGRNQGEEDHKSHFRKGIAGDWKNYFSPKVKDAFKDRYGQLLIDLEYERSNDW